MTTYKNINELVEESKDLQKRIEEVKRAITMLSLLNNHEEAQSIKKELLYTLSMLEKKWDKIDFLLEENEALFNL